MSLQIGGIDPIFTVGTTKGEIEFHQWAGDSWVFFFSTEAA